MKNSEITKNANLWLHPPFDRSTQMEVRYLIEHKPDDLKDGFYKNLEFGTGGMRGIMGVGTNRINRYTLGKATQGLSNFLIKDAHFKKIKAVIAYDCRHKSEEFAKTVADIFTANGIFVYLFDDLRETPKLSFAVRHLETDIGIVLTASHNPSEYNGYKIYNRQGCQITPPDDQSIAYEINKVKFDEIKFEGKEYLMSYIGEEIDDAFCKISISKATFRGVKSDFKRDSVKIVFTPLHGTAIKSVPKILKKAGFIDLHLVEKQCIPNGDFPTVRSPNPEDPKALDMAKALAEQIESDILIGCDPDCDRIGIGIRDLDGKMKLLNGNQTMLLMTDFLIRQQKKLNPLKGNEFIATTIVSSDILKKVAQHHNIELLTTLTGFKWIGQSIYQNPHKKFIGGGEESFGYMIGDFVRDKDGISSCLLACEMVAHAKKNDTTLYRQLLELYIQHGFYKERLITIAENQMPKSGKIGERIENFRTHPPKKILNSKVVSVSDYKSSVKKNLITGKMTSLDFPKSDVLVFHSEDESKICMRASGTEPKIKFYFGVKSALENHHNAAVIEKKLETKIDAIISELKLNP